MMPETTQLTAQLIAKILLICDIFRPRIMYEQISGIINIRIYREIVSDIVALCRY